MNDVINSHGYAQAAMWNRIPPRCGAHGGHRAELQCAARLRVAGCKGHNTVAFVLPFVVSMASS